MGELGLKFLGKNQEGLAQAIEIFFLILNCQKQ